MRRCGLTALLCLVGVGCGAQVEDLIVDPTPNAFVFSATFNDATGSETVAWNITGDRAWIDWEGSELAEGILELTVADADGFEVYRDAASDRLPVAGATAFGTPGTWSLVVRWSGANGSGAVSATSVQ